MTTQSEAGVPTRSTWQLDPAHTLVEFSGKHMMFTTEKRALQERPRHHRSGRGQSIPLFGGSGD
jgi:hypothetical protein